MGEPRNAASDWARGVVLVWRDRSAIENELPGKLAPDFVRHDRRRVVSMPSADRDEFLRQSLAMFDVMDGQMRASLTEVLAVRGERLCAYRARIEASGNKVDVIYVEQLNEVATMAELTIAFDPDDVDAAVAELDRLQELLGQ